MLPAGARAGLHAGGPNRSPAIYALPVASAEEAASASAVCTKREEGDARTVRQTRGANRIPGSRIIALTAPSAAAVTYNVPAIPDGSVIVGPGCSS